MSRLSGILGGPPEPVEDTGGPTFGGKWDRVTFLLSVYRIPLAIVTAAAIISWAAFDPSLPDPPDWLFEFAVPAGILAVPAYFAWRVVAKKVIAKISVKVIEYNGPNKDDNVYQVPPKTWKARETGTFDAFRPSGGEVYKVSSMEWMGDVGQLHVEGVHQSVADPNDVYKSQVRFDRIYIDLLKELMKAQAFQATVAEKGVEIYDESTKEQIQLTENGVLPDGVDAAAKIEELENEIENTLDIDAIGDMTTDDPDEGRIDERDPAPEPAGDGAGGPGGDQT